MGGLLLALDGLGISSIAVSLQAEGSCLVDSCCGISPCLCSEQADVSIGNSAIAYGSLGAEKSKGCCGEAHVCNAEEHWLTGSPCCFAVPVLLHWTGLQQVIYQEHSTCCFRTCVDRTVWHVSRPGCKSWLS